MAGGRTERPKGQMNGGQLDLCGRLVARGEEVSWVGDGPHPGCRAGCEAQLIVAMMP